MQRERVMKKDEILIEKKEAQVKNDTEGDKRNRKGRKIQMKRTTEEM